MKRRRISGLILIFIGTSSLIVSAYLYGSKFQASTGLNSPLLIALIGLFLGLTGLTYFRAPVQNEKGFGSALQNIEHLLTRVSTWFTRHVHLSPKQLDALCITGFVLFAALFTLGRWNGNTPFIFVYDDGGTYAGMAAALDHSDRFVGDILVGNAQFMTFYKSLYIPFLSFLNRFVGDYGMVFILLLPCFILLQSVGVYVLGKKVLKIRSLAFLLTIFSFTPVYATNWDYFGITNDVLTRQVYQCLVIYVFLLALAWKDQPKQWLWIMLILGLLTYIYPVSSIPVAFSIWLGLVLFFPKKYSTKIKVLFSGAIGVIYLITILPMVFSFGGKTLSYPVENVPQAIQILYQQFGDLLKIGNVLSILIESLSLSGLLPLTVLGWIAILRNGDKSEKRLLNLFCVWIFGVIFISIFVVGIEHFVEMKLGIVPLQAEMVRGLRYLPFFMELILFLALAVIVRKAKSTQFQNSVNILVIFFAVLYTFALRSNILKDIDYPMNEIACLTTGHITCQSKEEKDAIDLFFNARKLLPPHTRILSIPTTTYPFESAIRYYLLQPSGFSYSDINRLINVDPFAVQFIIDIQAQIDQEIAGLPPESRLQVYLDHAADLRTDAYIIALKDFGRTIPKDIPIIYQNDNFALISTHPTQ